MPKLGTHRCACTVHGTDDFLPRLQGGQTVKPWNHIAVDRTRPINRYAFGDDEANATESPSNVVIGNISRRNPARRMRARHGCHGDAIFKLQRSARKRREQRGTFCGHSIAPMTFSQFDPETNGLSEQSRRTFCSQCGKKILRRLLACLIQPSSEVEAPECMRLSTPISALTTCSKNLMSAGPASIDPIFRMAALKWSVLLWASTAD